MNNLFQFEWVEHTQNENELLLCLLVTNGNFVILTHKRYDIDNLGAAVQSESIASSIFIKLQFWKWCIINLYGPLIKYFGLK